MKTFVFALAVLVASVSAWPQPNSGVVESGNRDFVVDTILSVLEDYARMMRERGLDPYELDFIAGEYIFPAPGVFSASGSVRDVALYGISDISVNRLGFNSNSRVLDFDAAFTQVFGSVGAASGEVTVLDMTFPGVGSGSLKIVGAGLAGNAVLSANPAQGITIDALNMVLKVRNIESKMNLVLVGRDVSDSVNDFLNEILPRLLTNYEYEIGTVLSYFARFILNRNL